MNKGEIPFLTVAELGRRIEARELSPVEVTEAYLDRIDALDSKVNAYITVCRDEALASAREAEGAIARGEYLGAMHGIPVAVKDQVRSKGIPTTAGSPILKDYVPDEDATVIANLKRAGAILLGKANLTEFAFSGTYHGIKLARNPWDLERFPGGSSSGSAAATSAYMCATSLGEDTGGSILMPASWCGVVGMFASWGRVSRYGVLPCMWSMDAVGPIARTVGDVAITLGAIAGRDDKDPYTWDLPVPDYQGALDAGAGGVQVAAIKEMMDSPEVEPEIRGLIGEAVSVLSNLAGGVEEVSIPLTDHLEAISSVAWPVEAASLQHHQSRLREDRAAYGHETRLVLLYGSLMPATAYYKGQKLRVMLRQQVLEALGTHPVLVLPVSGKTAERVADHVGEFTGKEMILRLPYLLTGISNLCGCPAISVPCGFASDGMPVGLQMIARPGGEEELLRVAHAYEQATSWHTVKPPGV